MASINIEDAQAHLRQFIGGMNPGEPVVITQDGQPIAKLERSPMKQWPCKAGSAKGTSYWMAADFDAPLEDFGGLSG
jgi:antitoxin (DNA-binding transcriptional repressor) of toxin-antitoxin stability system